MQALPAESSELSLIMLRRSRSTASEPPREELPASAGPVDPAVSSAAASAVAASDPKPYFRETLNPKP
jgi:hypothetical protein